jgi:hypothetical protein
MNLESEVSNYKDFEIWADKSGWFKLRQYFTNTGTRIYWFAPTGKTVWIKVSSDGTIIDYDDGSRRLDC